MKNCLLNKGVKFWHNNNNNNNKAILPQLNFECMYAKWKEVRKDNMH